MKATFTIFKKELKSYFSSPIAYIILVVFLVLSGLFFFLYLQSFVGSQFDPRLQFLGGRFNLNDFVIRPYFGTISIVLLLMIPVITMRLIAEERKNSLYPLGNGCKYELFGRMHSLLQKRYRY